RSSRLPYPTLFRSMAVAAADEVDVDRRAEVDGQGSPKLLDHLRLERPDAAPQRDVVGEERSPSEVDHDARQRFVERGVRRRKSHDAFPITEGLRQSLAEHDAGVLDEVVRVEMEVARPAKGQGGSAIRTGLFAQVSKTTR